MKRIILHCGKSKTGTSYLQSVFAKNADLLARNNIAYPKFDADLLAAARGGITSGNGIHLALATCRPSALPASMTPEAVSESFLETCAAINATDILVSSELFETMNARIVQVIKSYAAKLGRELQLIVYLRAQDEALQSVYAQGVKRHHETRGPAEFLQKVNWEKFKYSQWLSEMETVVGRDAMVVCRYVPAQFHDNDLGRDFFFRLGAPESLINSLELPEKVVNPTPNRTALQFLRMLNRFEPAPALMDYATNCLVEWSQQHGAGFSAASVALRITADEGNFNEAGYLMVNADVAKAVRNGVFANGREHFEKFGADEQRKILTCEGLEKLRDLQDKRSNQTVFGLEDILELRSYYEEDNRLLAETYFQRLQNGERLFDGLRSEACAPGRTSDELNVSSDEATEFFLFLLDKMYKN